MAIRIARGFDPDTKPAYRELSDGIRPSIANWAAEPAAGLPIFDMDQLHNDPIVLPAGTIVGLQWDHGDAVQENTGDWGRFVPAVMDLRATPYENTNTIVTVASTHSADETSLSITITGWQAPVYPVGVVFKPIYAFTPGGYTNYRREHAVSIVTNYLVNIPARTEYEHQIRPGDTLVISDRKQWNNDQTAATWSNGSAGTFMAVDETGVANQVTGGAGGGTGIVPSASGDTLTGSNVSLGILHATRLANYLVGKCMNVTLLGNSSASTEGESLVTALTNGTFTINSVQTQGFLRADREFHGLDKVTTVPGHRVSGTGTGGVPGFNAGTFGARADSSGNFRMLTILIRIV